MKTLSFRFDIDGVGDIKAGVPKLLALANSLGVKFSFYVNMGKSFNWKVFFERRNLRKAKRFGSEINPSVKRKDLLRKHGLIGVLQTVVQNPCIGIKYRSILSKAASSGHELGLHGGMDHMLWQYKLNSMSYDEIKGLLSPAYEKFVEFFGKPYGFCCPGFSYNRDVLSLIDDFGFKYSGDMEGEFPFRPVLEEKKFNHYQVPVNIVATPRASLINKLFYMGMNKKEIVEEVLSKIEERNTAVFYGHPSVEGIRALTILENIIKSALNSGYEILTLREIIP